VEETSPRATLAVIVPKRTKVWFIKLSGDKSVVIGEQKHFEQFVRDITLPSE
jgi:hypothetical protein